MKLVKLIFFVLFCGNLFSQELNCTVTVITNAKTEVTTAEKEILDVLKQSVYDFLNNTKWTKDKFTVDERVNCQIQIQINTINNGTYTGSIQVQSSRPVFNGSYNTTLLNFQDDDVAFAFNRNTVLLYAQNQYRDNLASILSFYALYVIGLDYDSFSLKGGTPYFTEAQQIVTNAQTSGAPGWKSNEPGKRNRYWLIDNVLQQLFEPLRECSYEYHRLGMDKLFENKEEAKKAIYTAVNKITKVSASRPNSVNVLNFAQSKVQELKNLYIDATSTEKTELVTALKKIDPANASKYEEILN